MSSTYLCDLGNISSPFQQCLETSYADTITTAPISLIFLRLFPATNKMVLGSDSLPVVQPKKTDVTCSIAQRVFRLLMVVL